MLSTLLPALLGLVLPQDPPVAPKPDLDQVHLKVGTTLSGVLEVVTDSYVQIRVDQGTVLGFDRGHILRLERSGAAVLPKPSSSVPPRDEWFVLHDSKGRAVGTLHNLVIADGEGGLRLSESWRFVGETIDTEITRIETVSKDLEPLSAFHHEKVRSAGHPRRMLRERLARVHFHGDSMVIERLGDTGRSRAVMPFPKSARLPLLLAEQLRCQQVEGGELLVFDPASDSFALRVVDAPVERVVPKAHGRSSDGIVVREVAWTAGLVRHAEWLDATSRTVRREVNGEALVALPVSAARAAQLAEEGGDAVPPAARVDLEAGFGLRLPNPIWNFVDRAIPAVLRAEAPLYRASVQVERLTVPDAAESTTNSPANTPDPLRLALAHGLRGLAQYTELERREDPSGATVVVHRFLSRPVESSIPMRSELWIFLDAEGPLLLHLKAPEHEWDGLANDMNRLVQGLERHRAALAPTGSAPLLDRLR